MSYLIFCDIDHTLLSNAGEAVAANLEALEQAHEAGATVVLATARSYIGALAVHEALRLDTPLIVSNGTLVCQPDGSILKAEVLEQPLAKRLVELFVDTPHHWSFRNTEAAFLHPDFVRDKPHLQDTRHYRVTPYEQLREALGDCDALLSASLFSNGHAIRSFFDSFDWRGMGLAPSFYPPSHFDRREAMTVVSRSANKGNAARWVQQYLGLGSSPVLAIGDSPDDVTMYPLGIGVAPANASAEALAAADWTSSHCDEGAVAAAVKRFCLAPIS